MDRAVRNASDYNRGLPRAIRWGHVVVAAAMELVRPLTGWVLAEGRREWAAPLVAGVVLVVALVRFDGPVLAWVQGLGIGGDLRRELGAWQQFGALGSLAFVSAAVWLGDPRRRRRLLDLVAAVAVGWGACSLLKVMVGRPRPRPEYWDPYTFLWPWGEYPTEVEEGVLAVMPAWDMRVAPSADLWSMPSGHTAHAAVLAVFIAALYPRLRGLMWAMIGVVGFARLVFGAHWPTDVVAGAAVGIAAGRVAVGRYWGVRALDWIWARWVDAEAGPALPRVLAVEEALGTGNWSPGGRGRNGGAYPTEAGAHSGPDGG